MGQSYGKFSVPHPTPVNKGDKMASVVEPEKEVTNGEVVNGNVQLTDIPPITEPENGTEESGQVKTDTCQQNGGHDTLIKKCKKRAASWKAKTFNFKHSPAKEAVETVTTTDENNNLEVVETTPAVVAAEEQVSSEETATPAKVKKSKHSFRALMKRASSNLSKKQNKEKESTESKTTDTEAETTPAASEIVEEVKKEEELVEALPNGDAPAEQIVQEVMEAVQNTTCEADTPLTNGSHTEQENVCPEETITDKMANLKVEEPEEEQKPAEDPVEC